MIRLWCRLFGHRWVDHHDVHPGGPPWPGIQWCPRCGEARMR